MKNKLIATILHNIAALLELQDVKFKPQAYHRAAEAIESLDEDIEDIANRGELQDISGVGEHIATKIEEIIKTGKSSYYEKLKKEIAIDVETLSAIPGLGPKKIKQLHKELRIKTLQDLEKAIQQNKIASLTGFGEKTQQNIQEGITFIKTKPKRFLYYEAIPIVEKITALLRTVPHVKKVEVAGSFRRGKETVGDLDFLAIATKPTPIMNAFQHLPGVEKVLVSGPTKSSIRLENGMQVDLRVVKEKEWGSALLYFIGNKEHNVEVRKRALSKGYTLSEYGLFRLKDKKRIAGKTEQEIYKKLNLDYISPELRTNNGEIAAARNHTLPKLINEKDVNGYFHNHTQWSDGAHSLLAMAQKAEELGWKFISFNDHCGPIGITNPLTEKKIDSYLTEIDKIRKQVNIRVFSGVEIDILKDGTLPLSRKRLNQLDVVIASIHLSTKMNEKEMTQRVINAFNNYPINIFGHPTDRLLNKREPIPLNLEKIFNCAKNNNIFLEANGSPPRMDLASEHLKTARDVGCHFALSTDGHGLHHLNYAPLSVLLARRGWLEQKHVLNTWSLEKIEKSLKK